MRTHPIKVLRILYGLLAAIFGLLLWATVATGQALGWIIMLAMWLFVTLLAWLGTHLHLIREKEDGHLR